MNRLHDLFNQLSDYFGTQSGLAKILDVEPGTITNWKARGVIPAKRAYQIEKKSKGFFKAHNIIEICDGLSTDNIDSLCSKSLHHVEKSRQGAK